MWSCPGTSAPKAERQGGRHAAGMARDNNSLTTKYHLQNHCMARNRTPPPPSATTAAGSLSDCSLAILRSLRRILRRVELASFELESNFGITAPQLLCLRAVVHHGPMIQNELSKEVHLSASTLVGVLD